MRSHLSRLSFSIDVQCHAYETLETILAIHGKNWLEFYYRERRREKKGGKTYSRRAAYGATSEASLSISLSLTHIRLLKFRGWKRPPFLSLLDSCASPSAPRILFEDTRLLLRFFLPPPSVETLLTKRATIPRSIPPECPGVVFWSLGTTTVTEDVGQTSVWILQSS